MGPLSQSTKTRVASHSSCLKITYRRSIGEYARYADHENASDVSCLSSRWSIDMLPILSIVIQDTSEHGTQRARWIAPFPFLHIRAIRYAVCSSAAGVRTSIAWLS